MRVRAELLKGLTPALVLAVLAERPMHGYGLAKVIAERSAGALTPGQGTLYPVLHRLEREGAVSGAWETRQGGPERRVYRLTPLGHKALAESRAEWEAFGGVVRRFLASYVPSAGT